MSEKVLMKGNEAMAEAAIQAGCRHFFGYPITPQTEVAAYMAKQMPKAGGTFLQAESEVAAINMVYGASGAGARVMTSSSSPGISLKAEGISYIAGGDLPCVIVNIVRGGPGLGGIQPAQSDYFQATKGGGHGDYHLLVYAPASVQELVNLTKEAFDVADIYRIPVMIMGDGMLGQMMEPVEFGEYNARKLPEKDWATCGTKMERKKNIINTLLIDPNELEDAVVKRQKKYDEIAAKEAKYDEYMTEDAEIVIAAYGITSRIAQTAINEARKLGIKAGMIRPVTLWPFPVEGFKKISNTAKKILCVEMSMGQMIEDVKLAVECKLPVEFYGRTGGVVPTPNEILDVIKKMAGGDK